MITLTNFSRKNPVIYVTLGNRHVATVKSITKNWGEYIAENIYIPKGYSDNKLTISKFFMCNQKDWLEPMSPNQEIQNQYDEEIRCIEENQRILLLEKLESDCDPSD